MPRNKPRPKGKNVFRNEEVSYKNSGQDFVKIGFETDTFVSFLNALGVSPKGHIALIDEENNPFMNLGQFISPDGLNLRAIAVQPSDSEQDVDACILAFTDATPTIRVLISTFSHNNQGGLIFSDSEGTERAGLSGNGTLLLGDKNFNDGDDKGGSGAMIIIDNVSGVPNSNPSSGGIIYAEGGALKYRGSSGTITTIADA